MKKNVMLGAIMFGTIFCAPLFAGEIRFINETSEEVELEYGSWCGVEPFTKIHKGPPTKVPPGEKIYRNHPLCNFHNIAVRVGKKVIFFLKGNVDNFRAAAVFDNNTQQIIIRM
jgi:hypothetical protein